MFVSAYLALSFFLTVLCFSPRCIVFFFFGICVIIDVRTEIDFTVPNIYVKSHLACAIVRTPPLFIKGYLT